jgi:hypothetical protein
VVQTRIAIAGVPRLLRDIIVAALASRDDVQLVAELPDHGGLPAATRETARDHGRRPRRESV